MWSHDRSFSWGETDRFISNRPQRCSLHRFSILGVFFPVNREKSRDRGGEATGYERFGLRLQKCSDVSNSTVHVTGREPLLPSPLLPISISLSAFFRRYVLFLRSVSLLVCLLSIHFTFFGSLNILVGPQKVKVDV